MPDSGSVGCHYSMTVTPQTGPVRAERKGEIAGDRPSRALLFASRVAAHRGLLRTPSVARVGRRLFGRVGYQKLRAYAHLGYWPRIREPRTFNEKVMHRMLFGEDDRYTRVHDKLGAREYVSERLGDDLLPDLYHVTDDPETIPFASLPESYVVKSTLGSGDYVVVDGDVSPERVRASCERWLSTDYQTDLAVVGGNYCYDRFEPSVLVEERIEGDRGRLPVDYKFYVFHGRVAYVHVDVDRAGDRSMRFFDRGFEPRSFRKGDNPLGPVVDRPARYERMVDVAETLGEGFDFVRVDLYHTDDAGVVFGELTVGPGNGLSPFDPRRVDFEFGELW